ncbi:MAG: glutathione synthase [Desulfobacteraceae bacterium]|nr:glutathione synthase [Desulfobacteraceae bacterium]MCF8094970.1 glutathione synthase [Desulfobacteraceae bacterium]
MVLSFHPCYTADKNRLCAGRDPDEKDLELIREADAVILPQGCRQSLFEAARMNCPRVFPDYTARFAWPDKTGQIKMFRHFGAPHPKTAVFDSLKDYFDRYRFGSKPDDFDFPLVFKYTGLGEGSGVWRADDPEQLLYLLKKSAAREKTGQYGFLIQEFVETKGMCLRVVVAGKALVSYWRMQPEPAKFHVAAAHGAVIDHDSYPDLQEPGKEQVGLLCEKTGINLAGFDLIFPADCGSKNPLLLEVNYYFGRRGLGGSEAFYTLLCKEIDRWLGKTQ